MLQLEAMANGMYLSVTSIEGSNNKKEMGEGQMVEDRMLKFIQQIFIECVTCIRNSLQ